MRSTDKTSLARPLSDEATDDASEGPVHHLDHRPLTDQRAWVILQLTADESPDAFDLAVGNGYQLAIERDDADHARTLRDGQADLWVEACETVAGEQGPINLLFSIFPAAPRVIVGRNASTCF